MDQDFDFSSTLYAPNLVEFTACSVAGWTTEVCLSPIMQRNSADITLYRRIAFMNVGRGLTAH
jgi:hypothetical protein